MRNLIFSISILLLTTQFLYGENKDIKNIRKWFTEINQKANSSYLNYSRFQMNDTEQSTEGGIIIAFVSKKKFKKISVRHLGEMGKLDTDFYFRNNKVFFVYEVRTIYNAPIYLTKLEAQKKGCDFFDPKKSKKEEYRFYFKNNKLIRLIDKNNKKNDINSSLALAKTKEIFKEIKRVLELIKGEI